jgi:hypothetical protein
MRAFIATYFNEEQARTAADEYLVTLKDNEVIRELEIIPIGPRWRVGIIIDHEQREFDFD